MEPATRSYTNLTTPFNEVPEEEWGNLFGGLQHSKEILESKIENEQGPKKKKNAQVALEALFRRKHLSGYRRGCVEN